MAKKKILKRSSFQETFELILLRKEEALFRMKDSFSLIKVTTNLVSQAIMRMILRIFGF